MGTPRWAMENYSFNEGDPITLTFTYNYNQSGYSQQQTSFSLVVLNCPDTCPTLNCGAIGTANPACDPNNIPSPGNQGVMWSTKFPGTDNTSDNTTYNVLVPQSGVYPIGTYTAYVMAYLTDNTNVQSQPVPTDENIVVSPPDGSPPLLEITSPADGTYFANDTSSIVINGDIKSGGDYNAPYMTTLTVKDVTLGDGSTVITQSTDYSTDPPPSTYTIGSGLYPGQFSATLTTTAQYPDGSGNYATSVSTPVGIYIKLPSPTNVGASQ